MKLFSEKVKPTLTNSSFNIIQVEDFEEIFFGVYEIEINKTKYPVEKISEHNGDPVVSVPVLVEGDEKVYYPFVLSKGEQEVLFNENNTLETLETLEVLNEDVEIDIDDEIEVVDNSARILKQIQEAKQEAKRQTNLYNRKKLKEISEKTEKYEERLTGKLETARETLVDEFLSISKSIKSELIDSNDLRFEEISKTIDNKIGDLALSLSESLAKDSKTSSKQFDSNIRKLIVGMYKSKLTPMIEGEMKTIAEDIVERVDNIGTDLDLKLESKVDKTIVEGVNNEMDAIRESNIDLNDKINRGVNKALSRVGNVTTKVDELTIALAEEIDDKIAKVEGNITDYYTKKLTMLEEKNFNITEETRKYIVQLVSESRDNLVNEIHELKDEKPIEYLIESHGKTENIDFRGFKKDMNKDIDKRISDKISNEVLSLRRYIVTMGGGGGTVAMQFADGGTMQGSLNIVGNLLVVGSISASEYLGLPADMGGSDVSLLSANWENTFTTVNANSANWDTGGTATSRFNHTDTQGLSTISDAGTAAGADIEDFPTILYSAHIGHTGIANGSGCLGINADPTKFDITDGFGFVLDLVSTPENPSITEVNWTGKTALSATYLLTNNISFIGCDSSGDVVQQTTDFSESQRRSIIVLGVLTHVGSTITSVRDDATTTDSYLAADFARAIGNINLAGNNFNAASTDLTVRKEAGLSFIISGNRCSDATDPNRVTSSVEDPISFIYIYDNGAGGVAAVPATDIDPDNYDDGSGTLAAVSNNKWTNQLCYFIAGSNLILIRYGNEIFATQSDAELGAETIPPTIGIGVDADLVRTVINIKKGASDLSNIAQAKFIATGRFGLGSGGGAGTGGAVQDLQDVYDFSINPEILTDSTRGALSLKRGSTADTDDVLEVLNNADSQVFSVTGEGDLYASGNVGIGTDTPSARLHAVSTTEQARFSYDVSNYWNATTNASGVTTFDAVGSGSAFVFSDPITSPNQTADSDDSVMTKGMADNLYGFIASSMSHYTTWTVNGGSIAGGDNARQLITGTGGGGFSLGGVYIAAPNARNPMGSNCADDVNMPFNKRIKIKVFHDHVGASNGDGTTWLWIGGTTTAPSALPIVNGFGLSIDATGVKVHTYNGSLSSSGYYTPPTTSVELFLDYYNGDCDLYVNDVLAGTIGGGPTSVTNSGISMYATSDISDGNGTNYARSMFYNFRHRITAT